MPITPLDKTQTSVRRSMRAIVLVRVVRLPRPITSVSPLRCASLDATCVGLPMPTSMRIAPRKAQIKLREH